VAAKAATAAVATAVIPRMAAPVVAPGRTAQARACLESFGSFADAFAWLGGATWKEICDKDAAIALEARRHASERAPKYMVFDVETDGAKGKQLAIQLGYVVFDAAFKEVCARDVLLKLPRGRKINWFSQQIHKITVNKLFLRGVDPGPELLTFFAWVDKVRAVRGGKVIAHNAAFDAAVITNTAQFNGVSRVLSVDDCFCTMRRSTQHVGLTDKRGRQKVPGNAELYEILHGEPPSWATLHSAIDDCKVTAANYKGGARLGWWR